MPALARAAPAERERFVRASFPKALTLALGLTAVVGAGALFLLPLVFGAQYRPAAILAVPLALTLPGRVMSPALRQVLLLHDRGGTATTALFAGAACTAVGASLGLHTFDAGAAVGWGLVLGSLVELVLVTARAHRDGYTFRDEAAFRAVSLFGALVVAGVFVWFVAQ
jgi:O-antigen/teichoic acid export membrane protein